MSATSNQVQAITRLWQALEQNQFPDARDVIYLSNLQEDDIARLVRLWSQLADSIRQRLLQQLYYSAEADYEMDFSAVFHIALSDVDALIRAMAIDGLHGNNDVRLVSRFIELLHNDNDRTVRAKAAQSLGHFILQGELKKIHTRTFDRARAALLQTYHLAQEDIEVRRRALESLAYTGLDNIPDLIAEAYERPEQDFRISAVFAMGRSADPRWSAPICQELENTEPTMRFEAVRACGELELREAVPALVTLTEDVDGEIQQMALWALGQIGGKAARQVLLRFSESEDESLQQIAQDALDELEFFHGDLDTFFGPPTTFDGESDVSWEDDMLANAVSLDEEEDTEETSLWP